MLKQLMLRKKIEQKKEALQALRALDADFEKRSADVVASLEQVENDEEMEAVEAEAETIDKEKAENEKKKGDLLAEITELERELSELAEKANAAVSTPNGEDVAQTQERNKKETNVEVRGMNHFKFFRGMNRDAVEAVVARSEVKEFMERTRSMIGQKRAVTGAELTIPVVLLDLLRDNIHLYSKLLSKVHVRPVKGHARQNIVGTIPEGVWTEACGKLNELDINFSQIEVDGFKVGGFVAVCNAVLSDSDVNLADEILNLLAQAIGLALDKAILYGTGDKMPVGIVTRLANTTATPNLSTSNLLVIDPNAATVVEFYQDLITKLGVVSSAYSNNDLFWAMSTKTFRKLQAKALGFNAAGAVVSGQANTMPVIGGEIVELNFIPDDVIVGGYGSLYLLAEREGVTLSSSEHTQFIEDNTVFKGIARYDGKPVFGEAFVALNISQEELAAAPDPKDVTFALDAANA